MSDDNPKKFDQEFFLALARPKPGETHEQVRERWNAWRRHPVNATVRVTFEGVDFRTEENRRIRFVGFAFGDSASFKDTEFGDGAAFRSASFGSWAHFERANFSDRADFRSVRFGREARFDSSVFGSRAHFECATFGDGVGFDHAEFSDYAHFEDARFGVGSHFDKSVFGERIHFDRATFGDKAQFDHAVFGKKSHFKECVFGENTKFIAVTFGDELYFEGAVFDVMANFDFSLFLGSVNFSGKSGDGDIENWIRRVESDDVQFVEKFRRQYTKKRDTWGLGPSKFSRMSFASARFRGPVSFARRSFERQVDFTDVRFDFPPDFDGATNLQRIDFTGATPRTVTNRWLPHGWTTDSSIVVRWRALRSLIEDTNNHDFERDLYIEERRAERGVYAARKLKESYGAFAGHVLWTAVMGLYGVFSDYGRSWMRPAFWLGVILLLFHGLGPVDGITARTLAEKRATLLADAEAAWPGQSAVFTARYDAAVGLYAVANSIPFVGPLTIDGEVKKFLFCGEPPVLPPAGVAVKAEPTPPPCVPLPPASLQIATISQNLLSILLVFFIGLAPRNYFRLK